MSDTRKNLFFLLSIAPMVIAGCDDEPNDGDTGAGETGGTETGDGDGDPSAVCADYGVQMAECDDQDGEYATYFCEYQISEGEKYYGMECADAIEARFACLSNVSCEDLLMGKGCDPETQALPMICQ